MDYKEKHKEDLESAKGWLAIAKENNNKLAIQILENFFPELRESDDEKIRKEIISFLEKNVGIEEIKRIPRDISEWFAWLEKQGEQKSANSAKNFKDEKKPKFRVGDTIKCKYDDRQFTIKSVDLNEGIYTYTQEGCGNDIDYADEEFELVEQKPADKVESTEHSYITSNSEFFQWIYDRLKYVYNENPNVDYMLSLKERIEDMQKTDRIGYITNMEFKEDKKLIEENKNKLIEKVRRKFTIGDWIINNDKIPTLIRSVYSDGYKTTRGCISFHTLDEEYRLWTIQDAKEGDVLQFQKNSEFVIGIMSFINKNTGNIDMCCLLEDDNFKVGNFNNLHTINTYPARKEQIEKLFTKMKEAGYKWDPEKKELKIIKPDFQKIQWKGNNLKEIVEFTGKSPKFNDWFKTWEEYENYVHAHNNIFKLFNEDGSHFEVPVGAWIVKTPDGYNVASKSTFIQKHTWSEEDEKNWRHCLHYIDAYVTPVKEHVDWFKNIRNRVQSQSQSKQEWSEEDEKMLNEIQDSLRINNGTNKMIKYECWFDDIKDKIQSKPK